MKWMIFAAVALVMTSCSASKDSSTIPFLNGVGYKAEATARITKPTQVDVDRYEALLLESGLNIPLYRCVHEDGLTTYLGIPLELTFEGIVNDLNLGETAKVGKGKKAAEYGNGVISGQGHAFIYKENETMAFVLTERKSDSAPAHPTADTVLKRFQEH